MMWSAREDLGGVTAVARGEETSGRGTGTARRFNVLTWKHDQINHRLRFEGEPARQCCAIVCTSY